MVLDLSYEPFLQPLERLGAGESTLGEVAQALGCGVELP
jgi:hypothetical protein